MVLRLWVALSLSAALAAEETPVEMATDPFALINTLQIEPRYTDIRAGGGASQLLMLVGSAYPGVLVPGARFKDFYSIARLEMYGESLKQPSGTVVVGLQDWKALLLTMKPFAWGATLGLGVDAILPTATDPALDAQEFQLGPACGAMVTHVRHLQIGVLARFFFSVAGSTPHLAYTLVQPIITYHLPKNFFFKTDGIMNFDFRKPPYATVPVNLHLGYGVQDNVLISAVLEGVTVGSGQGNVTVKLNLNYAGW